VTAYGSDRGSGAITARLTVGLFLAGLLASLPVTAAQPAEEAAARAREGLAGWEAGTGRRGPDERRATRQHRRELRRAYVDGLPPERRRELRHWMRERRSDRRWLREALGQAGEAGSFREAREAREAREVREEGRRRGTRRDGESAAGGLRERLRRLEPGERRALRRRLETLRELPEPERRRLRERYRALRERPPEERERLREKSRRWKAMPPELRGELRHKMQQLRALPPEQRLRLLDDLLKGLEGLEGLEGLGEPRERAEELPDTGV
jgi:hypothetical protein